MQNPYQVVRDFEAALCEYAGAPYCVTPTSCPMAILLACAYHRTAGKVRSITEDITVTIPSRTYVGVPMSIIHAGFEVRFEDVEWEASYLLDPLPVFDSARYLSSGMYNRVTEAEYMICLSFHPTKHLGISIGGGAILHDSPEADEWLRMARFDGRKEGVEPRSQKDWVMGYHANMSPPAAAEGLLRLSTLPRHNDPLPNSDYPDLSKLEIFK